MFWTNISKKCSEMLQSNGLAGRGPEIGKTGKNFYCTDCLPLDKLISEDTANLGKHFPIVEWFNKCCIQLSNALWVLVSLLWKIV